MNSCRHRIKVAGCLVRVFAIAGLSLSGCGIEFGWDDYGDSEAGGETGDPDYERTYFIGECSDYSGECPNSSLNSVGFSLRTVLEANGWDGQFKFNSAVRLTQFIDGHLRPGIGQDQDGADGATFSMYGGHANVGFIQISKTDPATMDCAMDLGSNMSLSYGSGAEADVLAMASSCSGYARWDQNSQPTLDCFKVHFKLNHIRQLLAFHNSASVPDHQVETFFNTLKTEAIADIQSFDEPDYNNVSAWMDTMTVHYYPGKGENSPIVYTRRYNYGEDALLEELHYDTNLYTGKWVKDNPSPKHADDIGVSAHTSQGLSVNSCQPWPANKGCN